MAHGMHSQTQSVTWQIAQQQLILTPVHSALPPKLARSASQPGLFLRCPTAALTTCVLGHEVNHTPSPALHPPHSKKHRSSCVVDNDASLHMMSRNLLLEEDQKRTRPTDRTYTIQTTNGFVDVQSEAKVYIKEQDAQIHDNLE